MIGNNSTDCLLSQVRSCQLCVKNLPLEPKPIIQASISSKILIIGQAPGTKAHRTGIPWNDASGKRLRNWLKIPKNIFYNKSQIAIIPMGFCYPGRTVNGGDLPPKTECAPTWHEKILKLLPKIELTILIGSYAQKYYIETARKATMTNTVSNWRTLFPRIAATPHPSWRTLAWEEKNPWFKMELLPALQTRIRKILNAESPSPNDV
ncbi:MAG: hypothetical protein CFH06_02053 [Alphaproteobacteria bacterium MarineAlpha3_Bin5]|nr:hypothetical protein [Magnetovibrio sp.]PPR74852.1 MAG: hypothetical protein CFH06_02053 [Alphaproteobacteria bacterium MarineAlpha3_Bin5]|tara:strand:+ start:319 stop:939 length:621 start_codon:yes stop_codon:yes gene_type:complete